MVDVAPGVPVLSPRGEAGLCSIRVERGAAANALLWDAQFLERWQALRDQCPWATVYQASGFVLTWLETYRGRMEPVVAVGEDAEGELVGLLVLAVDRTTGDLVPAGTHHAEYQAWLALARHGDGFIAEACAALRMRFPGSTLRFLFLPRGAPLRWAERRAHPWGWVEVHANTRGIMALGDGATVERSLRKKSNKSRLQRLRRYGEVTFEHLTTLDELDAVLDEIIDYCDLRHGAVHGSLPFHEDPGKRELYRAMIQVPGLLHVTVLRVGGRVASAHLGARDGDAVGLGLIVHSPFLARCSPGKLHLLLLGRMLREQGIAVLDLTPGGAYKERFATHRDEVHVATIFFDRRRHMRHVAVRRLAGLAKYVLESVHIDPQRVRAVATDWADRVRSKSPRRLPGALLGRGRRMLWQSSESRVYVLPAENVAALPNPGLLRRDDLRALLAFRPSTESLMTLRDFLAESLLRLENGQHVFTHATDDTLVYYAWLAAGQESAYVAGVDHEVDPPPDAVVLDAVARPSAAAAGIARASMCQLMHEAAAIPGARQVCVAVSADDQTSIGLVESLGLEYRGSLFKTVRFGRVLRWSQLPADWGLPPAGRSTRPSSASE
ncbi:MAG: GNAT family N-acetyltransferase [Gemmatimonadaceae bacterium]